MTWSSLGFRITIGVLSFIVVCGGLVAAAGAIAMAVEWDIPEGEDMLGPSSVFDREGRPITRLVAEVERRPVPLDLISVHLQQAVVAKEDHRFYEHEGVDPFSVVRAAVRNVMTGSIREGGSTLTQQYVKNVYVGPSRTFQRKIQEAVISLQLEKENSKEEILEKYLNRVYFGDGAYGAEAAARTYFNKAAADLNLSEAAILASVLNAPSRFSPRNNPEIARERRDVVLDLMLRHGFIDPQQASAAKDVGVWVAPRRPNLSPVPYFVEEVRRQVLAAYGPELVYYGGLHIITTIDLEQQAKLEAEVPEHLPDDTGYDAGVAVVEPSSGDVLAAWSGRDFAASQVDLALGGGTSGRHSGSTFKVMVLAAALEEGMTLDTRYPAPRSIRIADWSVGGGGCGGNCTLRQAIVRSVNTVFAQLGRDVGVADFTDLARRLGVRSPMNDHDLSQALGTANVTPLDMASAFATIANDGVACPARVVREVRNPAGPWPDPPDPRQPTTEEHEAWEARFTELGYDFGDEDHGRCYRALAPSIARQLHGALQLAVTEGTGRNAIIDRPQAGKTGTSQRSRDIWFAGYTPDVSIATFFGYRDEEIPLVGLPGCRRACFGGDITARMWADIATALLADVEPSEFPPPVEDERVHPDRRSLGPATRRPAPAATEEATPEPDPDPTEPPDDWEDPEDPPGTPSPPTPSPTPGGLLPIWP